MYCDDRLVGQFDKSPNLHALIDIYCARWNDLQTVINDMLTKRDLFNAEGVNLDNIGVIVGKERPNDIDVSEYFTLQFGGGLGLSDVSQLTGGKLSGLNTEFDYLPIDDTRYRSVLETQIFKNHSLATSEDLLEYAFLSTGERATFTDGVGAIEIRLGVNLDVFQFADFVASLPTPAAIDVTVKNKDQL